MQRKTVQLGDYQYVVEYKDGHEGNKVTLPFVMIRKFDAINEIIIDTDIFLFEKSVYEKIKDEIASSDDDSISVNSIVFPVPESKLSSYSKDFTDFNINLIKESFLEDSGDVYPLLDKDGNEINILCDELKIYHPTTKINEPIIVCIENYINGIHFYYFCNTIENLENDSLDQIEVNNQIYSEYSIVHFPNFYELFKFNDINGKATVYYNENITPIISTQNKNFLNKIYSHTSVDRYNDGDTQLVPIGILIQPFKIIEETIEYEGEEITHNVKLYLKQRSTIENNYVSFPINVTLFPYANSNNSLYTLDSDLVQNLISFMSSFGFRLSSKLGFNNGNIAILSSFTYPDNEEFENIYLEDGTLSKSKVLQAYEYFYNVSAEEYNDFNASELEEIKKIDEMTTSDLTEYDKNIAIYALTADKSLLDEQTYNTMPDKYVHFRFNDIIKYDTFYGDLRRNGIHISVNNVEKIDAYECKVHYTSMIEIEKIDNALSQNHTIVSHGSEKEFRYEISNLDYLLTIYKALKKQSIIDEYEEELDSDIHFIGFKIEIASDKQFQQMIYKQYKTISLSNLNDFTFEIDGIFEKWSEMPDTLVTKISFVDRYLNNVIVSNFVVITKEWFKYIINNSNSGKLSLLEEANKNMKEVILSKDNINFINNISCSIKKESEEEFTNVKRNTPKIIYRPIFYKVSDIQQLKIRRNLKQNIGVNLMNYMTKVDTFKILIDGNEIVESMRNDAYVIFSIDAKLLVSQSGSYDIITQDDEYINTGNWLLY